MNAPWRPTKLAKVLTPVSRAEAVDPTKEYRLLGVRLDGAGPFLRETVTGSQSAATKLFGVEEGDFIYSRLFAWRGAFGVIESALDGCYVSGEFPTFKPAPERIDTEFLRLWFRLPKTIERVEGDCTGSTPLTRNRFKENFFLGLEIPLPPLPEQQRIVAQIKSLAEKIEEGRGLRQRTTEKTERLYLAALSAMMARHETGWKRETVADVIIGIDAGWSPQCDDIPAKEGEWGVLKTTSVQWCKFSPCENKALPASLTPIPELCVQAGDILVTRAGPRKRVGVVAAVRKTEDRLTISDKIIRLRPNGAKIEPRFLELSLASPFSQEHLMQRKTGLADAQVNISQPILRTTPVAYPSVPEQRRIVAYLDGLQAKVDELEKLQAQTAIELAALLPSMLDKAFKGEM